MACLDGLGFLSAQGCFLSSVGAAQVDGFVPKKKAETKGRSSEDRPDDGGLVRTETLWGVRGGGLSSNAEEGFKMRSQEFTKTEAITYIGCRGGFARSHKKQMLTSDVFEHNVRFFAVFRKVTKSKKQLFI